MKRLAIIGSGDLGQLIAHHAITDKHFEVVGFLDDFENVGSLKNGFPVIGKSDEAIRLFESKAFDCIMIGVGYKHMAKRKSIYESLKGIIPFGTIIHSSCYIDASSKVRDGSFLLPRCTIDKDVVIGENVLLNTAVVVAHDTSIDSHCFIAPAASIAGKVHIKESCIIGIGAVIIDNRVIEQNIQIGGGAVVIDNLSIPGLYVGVPAILKREFSIL
jgi:sugar O-acyltransferase (sialic acid O-acetyltransferase NeuD family)